LVISELKSAAFNCCSRLTQTLIQSLFVCKFLFIINSLFKLCFQNLLSESPVDDQYWPKELILLREKFTAKSQLEITQLNIKHAEEVSPENIVANEISLQN